MWLFCEFSELWLRFGPSRALVLGHTPSTREPIPMKSFNSKLAIIAFALLALVSPALKGATTFSGIAAGDMTANDAIIWTRAEDGGQPAALTLQISPSYDFSKVIRELSGSTVPNDDFSLKLRVRGLQPNTPYYYRFKDGALTSATGRFRTLPSPRQATRFKLAFSGDADAKFRPYSAVANFGTPYNLGSLDLNAFIFLGDVIYERRADGSPAVPELNALSDSSAAQTTLGSLNRKYLEQFWGVDAAGGMTPTGQQGLRDMYASVGSYFLLDNHEIFGSLQSGGAPYAALKENTNSVFAVNTTGFFNNKSLGFLAETKAFYNHLPTAVNITGTPASGLNPVNLRSGSATLRAPSDPRTHGTPCNWFSRRWGRDVYYIQLDDRYYRDARMLLPVLEDPANAVSGRTMLGATQLRWFKRQLLAAKRSGARWILVAVSTPIDVWGHEMDDTSLPNQPDSKSWAGGYPGERNEIMRFIAGHKITNLAFLTTDDHMFRVTKMRYQPDRVGQPARWDELPGVFQILSGPLGAGRPDQYKNLDLDQLNDLASGHNEDLALLGQASLGLVGYPGLFDVYRALDPTASSAPSSVDFFSPDTFGYVTLDFDVSGTLRVEYWGVPSYDANTYPAASPLPVLISRFSLVPQR